MVTVVATVVPRNIGWKLSHSETTSRERFDAATGITFGWGGRPLRVQFFLSDIGQRVMLIPGWLA